MAAHIPEKIDAYSTFSQQASFDTTCRLEHHSDEEVELPRHVGFKVYPELARLLQINDIGQQVIRVFPKKISQGYDWSFVLAHDADESTLSVQSGKLNGIVDGCLKFEGWHLKTSNDGMWCTVSEFLAFRKQNPEKSIPYKDALRLFHLKNAKDQNNKKEPMPEGDFFSRLTGLSPEDLSKQQKKFLEQGLAMSNLLDTTLMRIHAYIRI